MGEQWEVGCAGTSQHRRETRLTCKDTNLGRYIAAPYVAVGDEGQYHVRSPPFRRMRQAGRGQDWKLLHHFPQPPAEDQRLEVAHHRLPLAVVRIGQDLERKLVGEEAMACGDVEVLDPGDRRKHDGLRGVGIATLLRERCARAVSEAMRGV